MNNFLKNLGVILIVLGTLVLVLSYLQNWVDYNWVNASAVFVIICGLIAHIILNKRIQE